MTGALIHLEPSVVLSALNNGPKTEKKKTVARFKSAGAAVCLSDQIQVIPTNRLSVKVTQATSM